MAPLDWDKIMKADLQNLENDGDTFFEMLKDFDPQKESETNRLKQLFRVCQGVMNLKNDQLTEVIADMENEAIKDAKAAEKQQAKIMELEMALNSKKLGNEKESSSSTKYLRETVLELEDQIHQLNKHKDDLQRDLNEEKRANEKYNDQVKNLEKYNNELRDEVDQMRQDNSYYKKQLQLHRDNLMNQIQEEDPEYKLKLISKNQELSEAMEELQNLTDNNEELKKNCEILTTKLSEVTKNMEDLTDDYLKLKKITQEEDTVNDRLRAENQYMKTQISDLNEKLQSKSDSDDAIMIAVSHKVEEWKVALTEKDEEILTYQKEILKLRRHLEALNMDADRSSVSALTKVIEEKDKQISELTEEMKLYAEEMETNAAVIEDLRKNPSKSERNPVEQLQKKVQEQQSFLRLKDQELREARNLVKEADKDACDKDKQLCEALEKMRQYESGEYGLADAVGEIKELKKQLKVRERQNEELIQLINKSETDLNELSDENECLREQLGMDPKKPVDIKEFQSKTSVKREEQRALNIVLQKEVERLEDERIVLKQNLRKLAQQNGQRAVALGLTADDMVSIQDYTESLKASKVNKIETKESPAENKPLKSKVKDNMDLGQDLKNKMEQLEQLKKMKNKLESENEHLKEENEGFQVALKEILTDLKKRNSMDSGQPIIECPSLEKMVAAIEIKTGVNNPEMFSHSKFMIENLQKENEQLKRSLDNAKEIAKSTKHESSKSEEKIKNLENKIVPYQQQTGKHPGVFQPLVLPEGLPSTSAEVIANLNEHLIVTLDDLSSKEEELKKTENSLETYQNKMAVIKHQQGLLYSEYLKEKEQYESEVKKLKEKISKLEELREKDEVQLKEFDRLLDTLSQDDVEVRRRLAEQTRKITVQQIDEKALTRKYDILIESEGAMRKEITKLKNENIAMEKSVTERIGYLQRFKDTATFKISALQKALDESVPSNNLDKANKEYQELTEKFRDLLEKENMFVLESEVAGNLEEDKKRIVSENDYLKKVLEMEKDKVHTLEASMEKLFQKGVATSKDLVISESTESLVKRMTMLEMKELNERQRAEHAVHMYDKYKSVLRDLEQRNKELEENLSKVSKVNLELQRTERDLRDELANSVTKDVSDADRKRIIDFEQIEVILRNEISKLKEVSDVASSQVKTLEMQQTSRDKEVISLEQQLLDFQCQSNEKTVIGKLHRHIVQLQISEGTAVQKLESALQKLTKCDAQILRLEQQIDEKNQTIYHNRKEAHNKIIHLKRNLFDLRRQFSGAVPLSKQETFTNNMVKIREDKLKLEKELKLVQEQRTKMEDKIAELELLQSSQRELHEAMSNSKIGANKLVEWHSKLETLRLSELKQKRAIVKFRDKINFLEKINKHQEMTINEMEATSVRAAKEFEENQLVWEQRELELEKVISDMEKRASDIASVAAQFGRTVGNIPDSSLPVAVQLEQAISTIKQNMKTISETQAEAKILKQQTEKLQSAVREAEKALIAKNKLISELRLRMPATADRDKIIQKAAATTFENIKQDTKYNDSNNEQAMKVAQCAISSLKARIHLKEESIRKLQDLLKAAHDDMEKMNHKHFEELREMQSKIHANTDKAFLSFKEAARELVNKANSNTDFSQQINKITILEELVAEHEDSLNSLVERLKEKDDEILILRKQLQKTTEEMDKEKENLLNQYGVDVNNKGIENEKMLEKIKEQEKEMEMLREEISSVKDANSRTPSANMKRLIEQLRNQLSLKENQNQALGKALSKLRAEMVEQAEQTLTAHQEEKRQEINMQKFVEKHTAEFKEQIESLQVQNERYKNDLKKKREKEEDLESQLEEAHEEISKKNNTLQRLKSEKQRLQIEGEELEKKIDRFKSLHKPSEDGNQELYEMRRRVRFLEDEIIRKQEQAEKPYEQGKSEKFKNIELIKWEERKKWERTVEKMKSKIKEAEAELEKSEKEVKHLKTLLEKLQREKDGLEVKLKSISKTNKTTLGSISPASVGQDFQTRRELQDLKDTNFQQTEEISKLKRQLTKDQDQIVKEIAEENKHLLKEVEEMKIALNAKFAKENDSQSCVEYQRLFEKNQELQKQLLQLSKDNIELHFEMEQTKLDTPRLKARVEDLQIYVDALKEENTRLDGDRSGIKKVGQSGKSPKELEKIIALLKKVIDRVQAENEQLKKLTNVNNQTNEIETRKKLESQVKQLMSENDKLKNKQVGRSKKLNQGDIANTNIEEELKDKQQVLMNLKTLLKESAEREQNLLQEKDKLSKQIDFLKNCSVESGVGDTKLRKNYLEASLKINELEKEKEHLLSEVKIFHQKIHGKTTESHKDMLEKCMEYESLKAHNVELKLELKHSKLENQKSLEEIYQMKRELQSYGPEFFEEIEHLKNNYKKSVKKNVLYEDQLKYFGEKFGFSVNIPGIE